MSADSAVSVAWDVFKIVFVPIKRQFEYVMCSKRYGQDLQKEVGNLEYEVTRVRNAKEVATNNLGNTHEWVEMFLASAEATLREARGLLGEFEEASKTCCVGTLPDPKCRHQFSKMAKRKTDDIQKLILQNKDKEISFGGPAPNPGRREGKEVVQSTTTAVASILSTSMSVKLRDHGVFKSRASMIRNIMDALADNSKSVVGVYGMGGVGKSTLLEDVKRILIEEMSFDWVAKADVSKNPNIHTIQGDIAACLRLIGIKKEETISARAELLRERLQKEGRQKKKVLIILDNLWEKLDLKSVGIPCGHDNKAIGCQLLLTSRDQLLLQREMGCDREFLLGGLEEEEARALFERTVGDKVHQDEFRALVNEALHRCAGVPFLIVAMAKLLKHAALYEWKDTLKRMEKFNHVEINGFRDDMLKWSYDKLEPEVQALLRLCVVSSVSKPSLDNLVRYGFGLGLFRQVGSLEDATDRLRSHIRALQASALLLDSEDVGGFKIHDLVREFVSSRDHHPILVLENNVKLESLEGKLESCEAMCFPNMKELPQELNCPELRILLLSPNDNSLHIPDSYFNSMRNLMVLNLTRIRLTCSPSPFQFLANLHTLCFQNCSFEDATILGNLKGLQILSIVNSKIQRLPKEIGQLVELRLLDLSVCSQLEIIEPGVLGSLTKLEELYMEHSFDQWSAGEQTPPTNASLIELNNMKSLHTLHVSIRDPSVLPKDLNFKHLSKFRILIGYAGWPWREYKGSRTLQLKWNPTSDFLHKECIQSILLKTDQLFLDGLEVSEQRIYGLFLEGFPQLKHLQVVASPSVRYILERSSIPTFKVLETLLLKNLINLEKITNNNISIGSFSTLKVVRVESCNKMEVLFPRSVVRELPQLEEIEVVRCKLMRGIIEADDGHGKFELPKLRVLEFRYLPNIKNFITATSSPSSSTSDDQVGTQIALFNGQQVAIPRLETLNISGCNNVRFMFFPSMVTSLAQLRELSLRDCEKMEAIITEEEGLRMETSETLAFPMLIDLYLRNLKSLTCFSHGSQENRSQDHVKSCSTVLFSQEVAFPSLETLEVNGLDNLGFMFSPSMVKSFAQLRKLTVSYCEKMEAIIMEEGGLEVEISKTLAFPMLIDLRLEWLGSLTCFSRRNCSQESQSQDGAQSHSSARFNREVSFPFLESLTIEGLPNLKEIWSDESPLELSNLQSLKVVSCQSLSNVISSRSLVILRKLRTLYIHDCCSVQEIFDLEGASTSGYVETRSNLITLELRALRSLRSIWNKNPCGIASFHKLKELKVSFCENLGFLFFPLMVKSLAQLRDLTVQQCNKMEAITSEEEGLGLEISETLAFPMLTNLSLYHLESLTSFSRRNCSREARSEDRVKSHSAALFGREVSFPFLESLTIQELPNLREIWSNESPLELSNIRSLKVVQCQSLSKVISSRSLVILRKLQTLYIRDCNLVQEIFDLEGASTSGYVETWSDLTNLELWELRNLRCIWNKNPRGIASFHKLKELNVSRCENLEFLFFPSMVNSLAQLRDLTVECCDKMEAIISEEERLGLEISETLAFSMLTNLNLYRLESLTSFNLGKCSREVRSEDRVNSHSDALFSREVAFPRLEQLHIWGMDNIEMIWDDRVAVDSFPMLNSLYVDECNKLVNIVPSIVLGRLFSLERLQARSCGSLKVVCKYQPLNPLDGHFVTRSPLKELKLFDLPELKCVWDKELHRQVKFQCLHSVSVSHCLSLTSLFPASIARDLMQFEELQIDECGVLELIEKEELEERILNVEVIQGTSHELKVVLPFTGHFRHMKTLDVSYCHELSNMFTSTMAANLVALTKLRISKCGLLTEVISDEGGREGHVVAFNQLKYIELNELTGLRCFYSGRYALMLPLLEVVIVTGCRKMKFFSKGPIEASKLERVQISQEAWVWKGNLNITIQNMFEEMIRIGGVKNILLSEFPELIGKWHSELNPIKSSWQLESLTVDKCPSFINAVPSRLMLVLENMKILQVRDCESLEEIFNLQGLEVVESTRLLRSFYSLNLVNLPKLRQLWNKDLQGTMHLNYLSSLTLYKCSNLRHAFTTSMARCLASLWRMKIKECGQMEGVIVEEEGQGSTMEKTTFRKLTWLKLECLPNLTSFLLGKNHTLECPKLKKLTITYCPKMRSLAWQSLIEIDDGTPSLFTRQVQFPRLESIVLAHMDNLSKIWTYNPLETLMLEHLRKLKVHNCESLECLFPQWVATRLNQLKKVRVESCGIEEIVGNGDDTLHSTIAQVLFPKLTSMVLHDMPRLKSFYPSLPTLNWPFLEELRVTHCDKMNILSFATFMNKWTQRDNQQDLSNQEAQATYERDFPNLKRLLLSDKDIQMIRRGKFPDDIFGKCKALALACFHDENAVFPSKFLLERFQNMEILELFCCSFKDIFPDEGLVGEGKYLALENLRKLKLNKLDNLKRVWSGDYFTSKILQSIKTLKVWDCPGLTTVFPAATSFRNLTKLVVKNSSGLVHLGTASAVANLVNLTDLNIIGCERMKEVAEKDENGDEKVITFEKLKRLRLQNLPSLECFSSTTSCVLRFPSLWEIEVEECPKMNIFAKGMVSTPQLEYGKLFGHIYWRDHWEEELNRAIQKFSA